MNKTQINELCMYDSVNLVLTCHSPLFSQLEDLVSGHQRLKDDIHQIRQYRQVQETNNSGLTETKLDICGTLIMKVMQLSAALKSYANVTKNKE